MQKNVFEENCFLKSQRLLFTSTSFFSRTFLYFVFFLSRTFYLFDLLLIALKKFINHSFIGVILIASFVVTIFLLVGYFFFIMII